MSMSPLMSRSSSTSFFDALTVSRFVSNRRPSFSTLRISSWDATKTCHCHFCIIVKRLQWEGLRGGGTDLHLSVSVGVRVQQELNSAGFIWKFCIRELWAKALQHLSNLLHCHCKGLNGLQANHYINDREVSAHWTEATGEEAVMELPCEGRSSHSGNTPLLLWSLTPGGSHQCIATARPPNAASPPMKSRWTNEFGFLKSKGKSFFLQASSGGSHPGWSESPDRYWRRDWGWCWRGQWDEAPKSDADCPEMRSERTKVSRLSHHWLQQLINCRFFV